MPPKISHEFGLAFDSVGVYTNGFLKVLFSIN